MSVPSPHHQNPGTAPPRVRSFLSPQSEPVVGHFSHLLLTLLAHKCHQQVLLFLTGLAQRNVPVPTVPTAMAWQDLLHQG